MAMMTETSEEAEGPRGISEGVITGLLGAVVVAVFYFIVDLLRGHPLMTPSVLGQAFILRDPVILDHPDMAAVVMYSLFHGLAFIGFGLFFVALVRGAERSDLARIAVIQLLVVFEVMFLGVLWVASEVVRGMFPYISVLSSNTLAAAAMCTYVWRHHPMLRAALRRTPLGAGESGTTNAARP